MNLIERGARERGCEVAINDFSSLLPALVASFASHPSIHFGLRHHRAITIGPKVQQVIVVAVTVPTLTERLWAHLEPTAPGFRITSLGYRSKVVNANGASFLTGLAGIISPSTFSRSILAGSTPPARTLYLEPCTSPAAPSSAFPDIGPFCFMDSSDVSGQNILSRESL